MLGWIYSSNRHHCHYPPQTSLYVCPYLIPRRNIWRYQDQITHHVEKVKKWIVEKKKMIKRFKIWTKITAGATARHSRCIAPVTGPNGKPCILVEYPFSPNPIFLYHKQNNSDPHFSHRKSHELSVTISTLAQTSTSHTRTITFFWKSPRNAKISFNDDQMTVIINAHSVFDSCVS